MKDETPAQFEERFRVFIVKRLSEFAGIKPERLTVTVRCTPDPTPDDPNNVYIGVSCLLDGKDPSGRDADYIKHFFDHNLKVGKTMETVKNLVWVGSS